MLPDLLTNTTEELRRETAVKPDQNQDAGLPVQHILILCDSSTSGQQAVGAYLELTHAWSNECSFRLKLWHLEMLRRPGRSHWAISDADEADIIIVAWNRQETGLSSLRQWTREWAAGPAITQRILVALYAGSHLWEDEVACRLEQRFLQNLARRTGRQFLIMPLLEATESLGILPSSSTASAESKLAHLPIAAFAPAA